MKYTTDAPSNIEHVLEIAGPQYMGGGRPPSSVNSIGSGGNWQFSRKQKIRIRALYEFNVPAAEIAGEIDRMRAGQTAPSAVSSDLGSRSSMTSVLPSSPSAESSQYTGSARPLSSSNSVRSNRLTNEQVATLERLARLQAPVAEIADAIDRMRAEQAVIFGRDDDLTSS